MRRLLPIGLFSITVLLPSLVQAVEYSAGKHYEVLQKPVPTADSQRIEVVEVFWYGCKHCYRFTPRITQWAGKLAGDVSFVRIPAIWQRNMRLHASAYYTAQSMGILDQMHARLFDAMHARRLKLSDEREISDVFVEAGVEREQFTSIFHSLAVKGQTLKAQSRSRQYQVTGTPCIVVNGKYRVSVESAGGREKMLAVAKFLVERERQAGR